MDRTPTLTSLGIEFLYYVTSSASRALVSALVTGVILGFALVGVLVFLE